MAPSVKRRLTPVTYAKQLISAITYIRQQKQIPNFDRILRYVQRCSDFTEDEVKEYLNDAVYDEFIEEYTAVGVKGQRTGIEQEGYRILQPDEGEEKDDGHDWYCFECHRPGEVYECSGCFRVYHKRCATEDTSGAVFTCSICKAGRQKNRMKRKQLNTLLSYTISRLRLKTRELYKFGHKASDEQSSRFVHTQMDLDLMEQKVQASSYRCVEEFHADAQLIVHNCALVYGEDKGTLTELAIIMAVDSKRELDEIDLCPNCYYLSNEKPDDWFSEPCHPPHEIVYAKQKGYGYWPAKVVQDLDDKYDVRFFGGWHQRAIIPAGCVQPISTDLKTLTVKKTSAFQKSMVELKRYQIKLQQSEKNGADIRTEESQEETEGEAESAVGSEDEHEAENYEDDENLSEVQQTDGKRKQLKKSQAKRKDSSKTFQKSMVELKRYQIKLQQSEKNGADIRTEESQEETEGEAESAVGSDNEHEAENYEDDENLSEVQQTDGKRKQLKKSQAKRKDSSKTASKKAEKRKRETNTEDEAELDDEVANRQVTSTSIEKHANKRGRKSLQNNYADEIYTVTSTVDKITNTPEIVTVSTAVQTCIVQQTESTSTQTDDASAGLEAELQLNDQLWEERLVKALRSLTKRMENKFEEDKKLALQELAQQLQEDFGKDKQQAVERTLAGMKSEAEKARKAGEDRAREQYMEEMKKLAAKHKEAISQAKKQQWCQSCEKEAIYHCCWNTSYCGLKCQQEHWHKDHKRVCRRKRTT